MIVVRIVLLLGGVVLVWLVVSSAVRTVIVPRGEFVALTWLVFRGVGAIFGVFARDQHSYARRDRIMARYVPTSLMVLPLVWATGVLFGFAAIFWAIDDEQWQVLLLSGSSLTTLGFQRAGHDVVMMVSVLEALIGLGLVALLLSFLPTIYGHFSRRETTLSKLYIRAENREGVALPATLIARAHAVGGLEQLNELWPEWEQWFVEVGEAHTSFPALVYFRSQSPQRSWVNGAGIALDSAAIFLSTVSVSHQPRAAFMIRAGYEALRKIADFYSIPYDADPDPRDPVSVDRDEFLAVYDELAANDVPVHTDRENAWLAYQGWRVNYDAVLVGLAGLTMAPPAAWISDRTTMSHLRPPMRRPRRARGS